MFAVFGSVYFGFPGSGGLCTLVLAFIAGMGWSEEKVNVYAQHTRTPLIAQLSRSLDFHQEWQWPIYVDSWEVQIMKINVELFLIFSVTESYHVCG